MSLLFGRYAALPLVGCSLFVIVGAAAGPTAFAEHSDDARWDGRWMVVNLMELHDRPSFAGEDTPDEDSPPADVAEWAQAQELLEQAQLRFAQEGKGFSERIHAEETALRNAVRDAETVLRKGKIALVQSDLKQVSPAGGEVPEHGVAGLHAAVMSLEDRVTSAQHMLTGFLDERKEMDAALAARFVEETANLRHGMAPYELTLALLPAINASDLGSQNRNTAPFTKVQDEFGTYCRQGFATLGAIESKRWTGARACIEELTGLQQAVRSGSLAVDEALSDIAASRDMQRAEKAASQRADLLAALDKEIDKVRKESPAIEPVAPARFELPSETTVLLAAATEPEPPESAEAEEVPSGAGVVRGLKKVLGSTIEPVEPAAPTVQAEPTPPPGVVEEKPEEPPKPAKAVQVAAAPSKKRSKPKGDPMKQLITLNLRDEQLSNVVALLASKAEVNVVAGADVTGTVTASLVDIPLRRAFEIVLEMNGLGMVEEANILRILPYADAMAASRVTRMVFLKDSKALDVKTTLDELLVGGPDAETVSVSANASTNVVIIAGPKERVGEYEYLAHKLDVAEPKLPTATEAIKLNYAEPAELQNVVKSMLTADVGQVEVDQRGRHLIVTDIPAVISEVRKLIADLDLPVKQVSIEAMIVDAVIRDASQTGINWVFELVQAQNTRGETIGNLQDLFLTTDVGSIGTDGLNAGVLTFSILSQDFDMHGAIAAEVQSRNAEILANPVVVTVENKTANIQIIQEFPYQELTQTTQGPPVSTTEFKDIGVTLEVTPRVTHDDNIIANVRTKESSVSGLTETGVPIEDKREAETTLLTGNGQTIFIGGLRNVSDRHSVSKVPILGDIPVMSFLFRDSDIEKINTELMVFLVCRVLGEELPELTPEQQEAYGKIEEVPEVPDAQRASFHSFGHPGEMRDPFWKWRRPEETPAQTD